MSQPLLHHVQLDQQYHLFHSKFLLYIKTPFTKFFHTFGSLYNIPKVLKTFVPFCRLAVFLSSAADLLEKVGELVEKLFDADEELMKSWITAHPREEDDADSHPDVVVCLLEAAKQLR